jgi:hypothetical protein
MTRRSANRTLRRNSTGIVRKRLSEVAPGCRSMMLASRAPRSSNARSRTPALTLSEGTTQASEWCWIAETMETAKAKVQNTCPPLKSDKGAWTQSIMHYVQAELICSGLAARQPARN